MDTSDPVIPQPPVVPQPDVPATSVPTPPPPPGTNETVDLSGSMPPTEITPKNKLPLFLFATFIALVIASVFFYITRPKTQKSEIIPTRIPISPSNMNEIPEATDSATKSATNSASTDLPPLYPGVEWEATESGKITIYKTEPYGPTNIDGYRVQSVKLKTSPTDIVNYYKSQLELRNWNLVAETDNVSFYEKNGRYFAVGFDQIKLPEEQYQAYIEFD